MKKLETRDGGPGKMERRTYKANVRVTKRADGKAQIGGYAAVFGQVIDLGYFKEQIMPGAFHRTIAEGADVRCLFNHDPNYILGRTKSKTLSVREDDKGLDYSCDPPSGLQAASVVESIERGDVDGSSFGFMVTKQEWSEEEDDDGDVITTRRIMEVDLFDVSPVVFPAYDSTSCDMRALWPEGMPTEVRAHRAKRKAKRNDKCECECAECAAGNCDDCTDPECDDPNCEGHERAAPAPGPVAAPLSKEAAKAFVAALSLDETKAMRDQTKGVLAELDAHIATKESEAQPDHRAAARDRMRAIKASL